MASTLPHFFCLCRMIGRFAVLAVKYTPALSSSRLKNEKKKNDGSAITKKY
jgi:hypothetical protein